MTLEEVLHGYTVVCFLFVRSTNEKVLVPS